MSTTSSPQKAERPSGAEAVTPAVRSAAAWSWRILVIAALIAALLWLMSVAKIVIVPLAVALLLTVLLMPVRNFLERHLRFRRGLASISSLLLLLIIVAGLIALAGTSIVSGLQDLQDKAIDGFREFNQWLASGPLHLDSDQVDNLGTSLQKAASENQGKLISGAVGVASTIEQVGAGALIALFCTFFFLHDGRGIWSWLVGLLPRTARDRVHQAGRRGIVTLSAYTRTQILVALVDAIGIGLGAAILGVPLALPLGILVFVGSFIPIVGAVITGAVAVAVALVAKGWVFALIMLGIVLLVQQIEGHVLQPFLMGHAVSLHPVAVLLAVTTGSFAAGIVGALFAVPLAAVINTMLLYLHGHDKFPTLGTDDRVVVRGEPMPPAITMAARDLQPTRDGGREPGRGTNDVANQGSGSEPADSTDPGPESMENGRS